MTLLQEKLRTPNCDITPETCDITYYFCDVTEASCDITANICDITDMLCTKCETVVKTLTPSFVISRKPAVISQNLIL